MACLTAPATTSRSSPTTANQARDLAACGAGDGALMPIVNLGETNVAYTVRVSKRARRISVRYSQRDGLEVVYPSGITSPAPETLLQEKSAWVLANRERFRDAAKLRPARAYQDGEVFYVLGEPYTLSVQN